MQSGVVTQINSLNRNQELNDKKLPNTNDLSHILNLQCNNKGQASNFHSARVSSNIPAIQEKEKTSEDEERQQLRPQPPPTDAKKNKFSSQNWNSCFSPLSLSGQMSINLQSPTSYNSEKRQFNSQYLSRRLAKLNQQIPTQNCKKQLSNMSSNSPRHSQNKKIRLGQKKLNVFARKAKPVATTNSSSSYLSQQTGSLYHPHFQPLAYHQNANRVQNVQNPPFQTQNSSSGGTSSSHPNAMAQSPTLYSRREMIRISAAANGRQQQHQQPQQELPLRSESSLMMSNSKISCKKDRIHNNQFSSSHNHQIQKRIDTCSKISDTEWQSQSNITTNHTQHQGTKNQSFSMNDPDNHIVYQHNRQLRASIEVQQKDINDIANLGQFHQQHHHQQQQHKHYQQNNYYSINSPAPPIPKSQNTSTSRKKQHQTNASNKLKKIQASQRQASLTNAESPMHRSLSQPRNFIAHQFGRNSNQYHPQSQKFSHQQQQQHQQIDSHKMVVNNSYKMNYPHQKSQSQHANRRIAFQNQKRVPSQNINQTVQDIISPSRKFGYRQSESDSDRLNLLAKSQNYRSKGHNREVTLTEQKEAKSKRSQEDLFQSNGRPRLKVQKSRKSVGLRKTPSNSKLQQNSIISNQGSINQGNAYSQAQNSKRGLLESRQSKFNRAIQPKNQSSSRTKTHLKSVFNSNKDQSQHQTNNITIATSVPQNNSSHSISHNFQFQTHQHQQIQNSGSNLSHPHHSYVKKIQNSHTSRPSGSLVKSVGKVRQPDYITQKQNYIQANNNSVTTRSTSPNSRKKMIKHRSKTSFSKDQSLSIQNGTHLMMNDLESIANNEFKIDTPKIDVLHTSKARRPSQILSLNQDQSELKQQIISGMVSTTSKKSQRIKFSRQPLDGNKNISQPGTMIYPGSTKASRTHIKQHGQHLLPDIPPKSSSIMYMNATGSTTSSGVKGSSVRRAAYLESTPLPETNFTTQSKRKLNSIKNPEGNNNSEVMLNFKGSNNLSKDLFGSREIKTPRTNDAKKIESNTHLQRSQSINVPSQQQYYQHHHHHHHYNSVSTNLLENNSFKSQNLIQQNRGMPSIFGEQVVRQPSYPQTTKNQTSKIIAFKKINCNLNNTNNNNNSMIVVQRQDHQYKQQNKLPKQQPCMGAMPFSLNSTLAACEPNVNTQAGTTSEVLGKTSMGGSGTRKFEQRQENYVNSTCNRLTSVSSSPTSQNQRKLRKQKEYLAKNVNIMIPNKGDQESSSPSPVLEQPKFQGILGGSHYVSEHKLDTQDDGDQGYYEQQLNRIEQVESGSISQSPDFNPILKQANLISLKSIISPNNGAKAVETIHQENQGDSQFSTLIGKSLHKSLSNNNNIHQPNFQTVPIQNQKNLQQPKMNSIPESYNSSIEQNMGGTSSSICSSHRTPGKRVQPSQQGKKAASTPYNYKIEQTNKNQKLSTGTRYHRKQQVSHNSKAKSSGRSDDVCRVPVGMINLHSQQNVQVSQFSPLTAFSSDQSDCLAPFCFSGEEYTPTSSPSPQKRRLETEEDLKSTKQTKHNGTSGTGGISSKMQFIRSPSTEQTKRSKSKKRSDYYSSTSSYYQYYPNFNGSGSILRNQAPIKFHKSQQQQSIGEENVFQKRHDVSYAEQESFLQHVEARLHQLQFQLTFKKQKKQEQLSNMGDMGRSNRNKIIQKMSNDSIFQKNINSHNQRNSPLKKKNQFKINGNINDGSQIDMDILENYSFEID